MNARTDKTNPLNQCHNPAGCDNECEPGMNFCPKCMAFFGMKGDRRAPAPDGRYRHPLIGVGEAAQTHLKKEDKPMREKPVTSIMQTPSPKAVCKIHGEHGGAMIGKNYCPDVCPECENEKKSDSLKRYGKAKPRTGVMFEGHIKRSLERLAAEQGISVRAYVVALVVAKIPDDEYKAGSLEDMLKRGEP